MPNILNVRLILVLAVAAVSVISVLLSIRFQEIQIQEQRRVDGVVKSTVDRVKALVAKPITQNESNHLYWQVADDLIISALASEVVHEDIEYISVSQPNGSILFQTQPLISDQAISRELTLSSFPVLVAGELKANIQIRINTNKLVVRTEQQMWRESVTVLSVSGLLVVILFAALNSALRTPLNRLHVAQKTFDSMDNAIAFTNSDGIIGDVNPAFCHVTGLDKTKCLNRPIREVITKQSELLFGDGLKQAAIDHWRGESVCKNSEGNEIPIWLNITPVGDLTNASMKSSRKQNFHEYVFVFQDITSRKEVETKLERLAFFDPLTDVANRQFFETELDASIQAIRSKSQKVAVAFIDVDNFKHINDSLGHEAGDKVLQEIAQRFKSRIRGSDFLARLGGDEFTVIIRNVKDTQEAATLARDLVTLADKPINIEGLEFHTGASIGLSVYPDDSADSKELIKHADIAMYNAKEKGKGQFSFYSEQLNTKVDHYFDLRSRIDSGIKNDEFILYFQPKVDLLTRKVKGAEALIRWSEQGRKLVRPDVFIPMAEETRQIIPLGRWIMHTAIQQLKHWRITFGRDFKLAVNLSPVQLHDAQLIEFLQEEIFQAGINPAQLEIEITESAVIQDASNAIEKLHKIKSLGVKIALDDFGTGYSSLSYLKQLPVDTVKIDRTFLIDSNCQKDSDSILTFIIQLSKSLKIDLVAEGIEDEAHLNFLVKQGCRLGQGHLFSAPVPGPQFKAIYGTLAPNNIISIGPANHA